MFLDTDFGTLEDPMPVGVAFHWKTNPPISTDMGANRAEIVAEGAEIVNRLCWVHREICEGM
jgi:hypothetical protein